MKNANRIRPKGSKSAPRPQPQTAPQCCGVSAYEIIENNDCKLECAVAQATALLESQAREIVRLMRDFAAPGSFQETVSRGTQLTAESVSRELDAAFRRVHHQIGILLSIAREGSL
jgi:hypothetical protein